MLISYLRWDTEMQDKSTIELLDMFAGYALSGYVREGVSFMSREEECQEVARACYDLAFAMLKTRQEILDERQLQIDKEKV